MKKIEVISRHTLKFVSLSVMLTGCQAIDNTFGAFAYLGIGLISFVVITIVIINFTAGKIVLRRFRSLF